ncbi:LacI family DNA-binding transcriptional regulator [Kineococcus arenarius]|uniref:LacI family DNA-binding transcriptional regulator n=1 Tax=unclassified Kineococcus TaxID=2621656 RepID=UPI003D7E06F8
MPDRPAKLLDVARLAGVGKTTASDALSGTGRISTATRAAVLEAARTLNYRPNGSARHLRRASTGAVAVALAETLSRSHYFMAFVFGIVAEASRRDYDVTIVNPSATRDGHRPLRADGVIVADPTRSDPFLAGLLSSGATVVSSERLPGPGPQPAGTVWSAHEQAMHDLLDAVGRSGARRPGLLVADESVDWAASLARGYRAWCDERGIAPALRTVPYDATWASMQETTAALLQEEPDLDALVCGPDGSASEIAPVLSRHGRTVGHDFALAACVDSAPVQTAAPAITALDLDPRGAGAACARLLFDLLEGTAAPGTAVEHPVVLRERASTAAFR